MWSSHPRAVPSGHSIRPRGSPRGKVDAFGHAQLGGIGQLVADALEERTGYDTRVTVLGHVSADRPGSTASAARSPVARNASPVRVRQPGSGGVAAGGSTRVTSPGAER